MSLSNWNWGDPTGYVEELLENPSCTTVYSEDQYISAKEKDLEAKIAGGNKEDVIQKDV